ncbi:MAG: cadherin domain-containing protein [Novosphingobium sp.]|uniref:cadherin domain-containing protein n=1 Tax=Novosphingobium sp. TaxID=1874826 RepID=UPI003B9917EE
MAEYLRSNVEFVVNSTYERSQRQSDVTRLANGDFIVTWFDTDLFSTGNRVVRAQIFHADGNVSGSELILLGPSNAVLKPTITALANGGFVLTNSSSATVNIFDSAGIQIGSTLSLGTYFASNLQAVTLADGGFAVVWSDSRTTGADTSGSGIRISTFDQAGNAILSEVLVNTATAGSQALPSITGLSDGGFVVAWTDQANANWRIKAQIFDALGSKVGSEFSASTLATPYGDEVGTSTVTLTNGNFAIAWHEGYAQHVRVFTPTGVPVGAEISVPAYYAGASEGPELTALSDGAFVITWVGNYGTNSDGSGSGIYFQAYDAGGAPIGAVQLANTMLAGDQIEPSVVALDNGSFAITWTDMSVAGSDNDQIRSQIFVLSEAGAPPSEVTITSAQGSASSTIYAVEGDTAVAFVTAQAPQGSPAVQYAITGGADAAQFTIDASTGLIRFAALPDFEAPADAGADNVYDVIVTASDGITSDSQVLAVRLTDMNDAPTIISPTAFSINENTVAVTTLAASDLEGQAVRFYIAGGPDADRFTLNSQTGALSLVSARNFEAPGDADSNNVYVVSVKAQDADSVYSTVQTISVTINNVIEGTAILSNGGGASAAISMAENLTAVTTVIAADYAGSAVSYAISGGVDAAKFTINSATGELAFVAAPNFEAPNDSGFNRVYDVVVSASDGFVTDTQALAITITNVNEAPVITANGGGSTATIALTESSTYAGMITSTDPEGTARTYSIVGGADSARFAIMASSGVLTLTSAPNFEAPTDANGDNVYDVIVQASDGVLTDTQAISVNITNVNETPIISSPAAFTMQENTTMAGTVAAADPDGAALTFAITGGLDAARFAINAQTGQLSFVASPNFEAPTDSNADNIYQVIVRASDGVLSASQTVNVTVSNLFDSPEFTSPTNYSVAENTLAVGTLAAVAPGNLPITYAISGGLDAARFAVDAQTGALNFVSAPNFEAPNDSGANRVYNVTVSASSGGETGTRALAVTLTNVNEAPIISSNGGSDIANVSVAENSTTVTTVVASDPEGTARTYAIIGGADAARFSIVSTSGALRFVTAPNHESPTDADGNNVYEVIVRASDGTLSDTQTLLVGVTNVNEAPTITSNLGNTTITLAENTSSVTMVTASDPDSAVLTYAIVGGTDAANFIIDAASGALAFVQAPDFEAPADANADNSYQVIVRASDGALSSTQTLTVVVSNVNETPVIVSDGGSASASLAVMENTTAVTTVIATDQEGTPRSYAIAGGSDAAKFTIDAATGVLSFAAAPDHDIAGDTDGDNVYDVIVQASDGLNFDTQALAVTVGNANEAPLLVPVATLSVLEGQLAVGTIAAIDVDGQALTYNISGGADAALFAIDAQTGALNFVSEPDFEAPGDTDADNRYDIEITVSDGSLSASQMLTVAVGMADEAPAFTSGTSFGIAENATAVSIVAASDPEGSALTYAITAGADAALFSIDVASGALAFITAPDHEAPVDDNSDNLYEVVVSASDGINTTAQTLSVSVTDINEAVAVTSAPVFAVSENTAAIGNVEAVDPEGSPIAFSIAGGADAAMLSVDAATGALSFVNAPDFEAPGDANDDNLFEVLVRASDGTSETLQSVTVTVGNVNEAPVITAFNGLNWVGFQLSENTVSVAAMSASDPDGSALTYSIGGGADAARFAINSATGQLSFVNAPNFEAPGDIGADNVYQVIVNVSDGELSDSQTLSIGILDVADGVTLTGTSAANTLTGGAGDDVINGLAGNDTLNGGAGVDRIDGGNNNDVIIGGAGGDRLTGGAGADTFTFQNLSDSGQGNIDFITDFSTAQADRMSLGAIDANSSVGGNQGFTFIGTAGFSNVAGQLRYYQSGGDTFVTGDVNGDGVGDFLIQLDPLLSLAASNFVL